MKDQLTNTAKNQLIYLIEETNCRGDRWTDKYKAKHKEILFHFEKLINMDGEGEMFEYVEDLKVSDLQSILEKLISTCFVCCDNEERLEELDRRYKMLLVGEGNLTFEESEVGFGLDPKTAIMNLVEVDLEEEW